MDSTFNALAAALRRIKREAIAAAPTAAPDDVIADAALLRPWTPGDYAAGDVRVQDVQVLPSPRQHRQPGLGPGYQSRIVGAVPRQIPQMGAALCGTDWGARRLSGRGIHGVDRWPDLPLQYR